MKKHPLLPRRVLCLLLLLLPLLARGQTLPLVHKISVQFIGPPAVSDAFILANIRTKEGERLYRATIEEDETSLYATGFFYHVRVDQTNAPDGSGVDLVYIVEGKPIVTDIRIIGNKKLSLAKLKKKLTSKTGQPLDELKLFHDAEAMKDLYQKKGYPDSTVTVQPPSIDQVAGRASVSILVVETPKVILEDVIFDGATAFTQKKLRHVLKTRRHWMFSWLTGSGVLKKDEFDDDKDTLVEFYQNEGYIDFAIQDIKYDHPTPKHLVIHIVVSEGRQYRVGTLTFRGNTLFTTNDFIKGIVIDKQMMRLTNVPGAIFKPAAYDADRETIENMYSSKGYLTRGGTTIISASRTPNTTTSTMDLAFDIQEGEKCYIEKIEIKGNVKTKDKVVRRELAVFPGEVYDMVRVKISKQRLENMDYFTKVDTEAEETEILHHKNLSIGLEETSMSSASIGAGFSSVESIVGFVEVKMKNFDLFDPPTFTGAGQKLNIIASVGSLYQDYEINFVEPFLLGGSKRLALGVNLFHKEVDYDSVNSEYTETFDGGTVSLNKGITQRVSAGVSYTLEAAHLAINSGFTTNFTTNYVPSANGLSNVPSVVPPNISTNIYDEHGTDLINKFGLTLGYDSRSVIKDNDRGEHIQLEADIATPPGDTEFYKLELKSSFYFRGFRPGDILQLDARGGVVDSYGGTTHVPIYERWFLGGLYSLRGYRYHQSGPLDQFAEPLGGDTYFFGGAEYSIPLVKIVRLAWFYDIGNVYQDPFSFKLTGRQEKFFEDDAGIGLRIVLPIGGGMPLRLDYAFPITHDPDVGSSGRVQIGVGYTRDF